MSSASPLIPIQQLLVRIDTEYASAVQSVADLQSAGVQQLDQLGTLADQRTAAFVELAEHYLPELSHQTLANTWLEVRGKIRDILLLKEDRCRTLRAKLKKISSRANKLEQEQHDLRQRAEKARLDHSSKLGNVHKALREDRDVATSLAEVRKIDSEIEQALDQLDIARSDAEKKLPSYEASSLFRYLRDRRFGTPQYSESGLERRWDRWLAKLIGYRQSKKSYEFLSETPRELEVLIDRKRDRYQSLLKNLEQKRADAIDQFDLSQQAQLLEGLSLQLARVDRELADARHLESEIGIELCEFESIDGEYYFQAIEVYRNFLAKLDPEILRVYAECTESPVDDQICARVRSIGAEIEHESDRSRERNLALTEQKKYRSAVWELGQRLRQHINHSSLADEMIEAFPLEQHLLRLRQRTHSPTEVWHSIRESIVYRADRVTEPQSMVEMDPTVDLMDASFLAAMNEGSPISDPTQLDPLEIRLVCDSGDAATTGGMDLNGGFQMFAVCHSRAQAQALIELLEQHDIPCFAHDRHRDGPFTIKGQGEIDGVLVMVKDWRIKDAIDLVADLTAPLNAIRVCSKCEEAIQSGHQQCWNCLASITG